MSAGLQEKRFQFKDLQVGDLALLDSICLWWCVTLSRGGVRRGERSRIQETSIEFCGIATVTKHASVRVSSSSNKCVRLSRRNGDGLFEVARLDERA